MTDRGSGTILAFTVIGVAGLAVYSVCLVANVSASQLRLQRATGLAAVAADQTLRGLNTGIPCERSSAILTLNMANQDSCLIVGDEVKVASHLVVMGIVLDATATAAAR